MKRTVIIATVALILALAVVAWADHGDWTVKGVGEGLVMLDAFGVSDSTVIFLGMNQSSSFGMDFVWKSENYGASLVTLLGSVFSGTNMCEMLALFEMGIAADFPDEQNGIMMGLGFPQECIDECEGMDEMQAMLHMFVCMLQAGTKIQRTTNSGDDWSAFMLPDSTGKTLDQVDMIDANVGYAGGYPEMLMKTIDGGQTWTDLPSPVESPSSTLSVTHINFVDENLGYLASGMWETEKDKGGQSHPYDRVTHLRRYRTDPSYRFAWDDAHKDGSKTFNSDGAVYKTTDGGQTWTRLFSDTKQAVNRIHFFDELHGVMLTDKMDSTTKANNAIYYTTDGGVTWTEGAEPGPLPDLPAFGTGRYFISDIQMVGKKLVYAVGAADRAGGAAYSVIFISQDGGATWEEDMDFNYSGSARVGNGINGMGWFNGRKAWTAGMYFERAMYEADNFGPVADAGQDNTLVASATGTLDGSGSYDDNGDALTYTWKKTSGPDLDPYNTSAEIANFIPTEAGTYVFLLTVSDGELSDTDEVTVTVTGTGDDDDDDDDDATDDDDSADDDDDDTDDDGGCCG